MGCLQMFFFFLRDHHRYQLVKTSFALNTAVFLLNGWLFFFSSVGALDAKRTR